MFRFRSFPAFLALVSTVTLRAQSIILMNDPGLQFSGRIDRSDPLLIPLHWSGSLIRANFTGTSLSIRAKATPNLTGKPDEHWADYLWVIVDGKEGQAVQVKVTEEDEAYPVASGLANGTHSLLIMKKSEAITGDAIISQLMLDQGCGLAAPPRPRTRKIEFFGDSLTCAYGVDCPDKAGEKDDVNENAYHSWARVMADRFNANYHIIAQTGIGLRRGYTDRLLPDVMDGMRLGDFGATWDYSKWQADLVILNFLGNDADFGMDKDNTLPQYQQSYLDMIRRCRAHYPKAVILCTMGETWAVDPSLPWVGIYNWAVKAANAAGDTRVFAMPKGVAYTGIKTHPKKAGQEAMAAQIGDFVHEHTPLGW